MTPPLTNRASRDGSQGEVNSNTRVGPTNRIARAPEVAPEHFLKRRVARGQIGGNMRKPLRVMKFGGTSVGDASCIARVVEIVRTASRTSTLVVVVSAMASVTNKLIEAGLQSAAGDRKTVAAIFKELRKQHSAALNLLIHLPAARIRIGRKIHELFQEGERLWRAVILQR